MTPVDPTMLARPLAGTGGPEWSIGALGGAPAPAPAAGGSFGGMLAQQIGALQASQDAAAQAGQELATGQATDPTAVVMAVERARLEMQLASTVRTKAVDALNDVFHTQV